jgi:hypothetical protein
MIRSIGEKPRASLNWISHETYIAVSLRVLPRNLAMETAEWRVSAIVRPVSC